MVYNNIVQSNNYLIGMSKMINENEYKEILLDIGLKIGYYRRKAGMTLSYISQLESPNLPYCPSVKAIFTIAKALGIKASKLIDIDD